MSNDQVRAKLERLKNEHPEKLTIIRSAHEVDRFMQKVGTNFEMEGPFNNGDVELVNTIEKALIAGKLVGVQAAGSDKILVLISTAKKSGGCFIATAACGDASAPEIIVLSAFRDDFLLPNRIGHGVVRLYYGVSPTIARVIARSSFLRRTAMALIVRPAVKLVQTFGGENKSSE